VKREPVAGLALSCPICVESLIEGKGCYLNLGVKEGE